MKLVEKLLIGATVGITVGIIEGFRKSREAKEVLNINKEQSKIMEYMQGKTCTIDEALDELNYTEEQKKVLRWTVIEA